MSEIIIGKLKDIQEREGLSDAAMAERLGCSRQTYNSTRLGRIPTGNKILKGVSTAFPELKDDVIYFLSSDANKLPDNAKYPLRATSEAQGRGLKGFLVRLLGRFRK